MIELLKKVGIVSFLLLTASYNSNASENDSLYVDYQTVRINNFINSNNDSSSIALEELRLYSERNKSKKAMLNHKMLSGFLEMKKGNFQKAIKIFESYIKLDNDSTSSGSIDQINRIAQCHKYMSTGKAKGIYQKANELALNTNYWKGIADSYTGIGQCSELEGKYKESISLYLKSSEYFQKNKDSLGMSTTLNNIGNVMYYQGEMEQALEYYKRSSLIYKLINDTKRIATSYGNIGMIYNQMKVLDSALHYNLLCMEMLKQIGNAHNLGTIYNNVALVYFDLNEMDKSLSFQMKSKEIKEKIGDKNGLATSLINIGNIYVEIAKFRNAIPYYNEGLKLALELNSPLLEMNAHKGLSKVYGETNQHKKALLEYIHYSDIEDSLNSVASRNAVLELETKYETSEKEKQLIEQKKAHEAETAIANTEKEKQQYILVGVVVVAFLIIVFAIVVFKRLKITRKQKLLIEEKNKENELLLGEIHHRVKNNLQVISSLLSLQERNITDETAKAAILDGKERVQSMGLIHKMLYQQNNFSGINMSEYIEKLISGLLDSFGKKSEEFALNYDIKDINLDVDTAIPLGLIINELVVNALKHAYSVTKEPKINVNLKEINNQLVLEVEDNGAGVVADVQSSESFGMKLVNSLSRQLRGTIDIEQRGGLCFKIAINDYKLIA
jgi:two-component system, sensor histidine kinase PdtaS